MGKNGSIVVVFVFILVSTAYSASIGVNLRKLITNEPPNSSVSPTGNPTNQLNKSPPEDAKPKDLPKADKKNNTALPTDLKNTSQNSTDGNLSTGKTSVDNVDGGNAKGTNQTTPKSDDDENCEGHLTICMTKEMVACVKATRNGSALFIVVQNKGKSALKVYVNLPYHAENPLRTLDVAKLEAKSDLPSYVNRNTELVVKSGKEECVLRSTHPISVDKLIQQLSFYSKQVTPIYAVYGSFLLVFLFGGTWACCTLRKRKRENEISYQELEMGMPESASAADVDAAEGWDHDWDDDDWDEDVAVKSPAGLQVRNVSADGLTSRSPPKKDGWEIDWED